MIARTIKQQCNAYTRLAECVTKHNNEAMTQPGNNALKIRHLAMQHAATFEQDGNLELMHLVLSSMTERDVLRLCTVRKGTFSKLKCRLFLRPSLVFHWRICACVSAVSM